MWGLAGARHAPAAPLDSTALCAACTSSAARRSSATETWPSLLRSRTGGGRARGGAASVTLRPGGARAPQSVRGQAAPARQARLPEVEARERLRDRPRQFGECKLRRKAERLRLSSSMLRVPAVMRIPGSPLQRTPGSPLQRGGVRPSEARAVASHRVGWMRPPCRRHHERGSSPRRRRAAPAQAQPPKPWHRQQGVPTRNCEACATGPEGDPGTARPGGATARAGGGNPPSAITGPVSQFSLPLRGAIVRTMASPADLQLALPGNHVSRAASPPRAESPRTAWKPAVLGSSQSLPPALPVPCSSWT